MSASAVQRPWAPGPAASRVRARALLWERRDGTGLRNGAGGEAGQRSRAANLGSGCHIRRRARLLQVCPALPMGAHTDPATP